MIIIRILVVEDEKRLADTIAELLKYHQHLVDICHDGEAGYDCACSDIYDLIILDVMLPLVNGFDFTQRLRESKNNTPILMLTAKSEVADRVKGLNSGADYYLTKPFDIEELLACVNVLLRRQMTPIQETLEFGDVVLDLSTSMLINKETQIRLSAREFEIMRTLMLNREANVSKENLLTKIWGFDSNANENHVEVFISFLRKKLQHIKSDIKIVAIRRQGYHLEG